VFDLRLSIAVAILMLFGKLTKHIDSTPTARTGGKTTLVLQLQTQAQTPAYWTTNFKVTRADIEYLFSLFLEDEIPLTTRELSLALIRARLAQEEDKLRKQLKRGDLFQPKNNYKVGQEVIFPLHGFAVGKVIAERAGQNPTYGEFKVIEVEFEGQPRREFASGLQMPHVLNDLGGEAMPKLTQTDAETIYAAHGEVIGEELEARLVDEPDAVFMGGKWFLQSLVAPVNVGHLHLAEAILDLAEGGPLAAAGIVDEIGFAPEVKAPLREFSLDVGLSQDERFDNVGAVGHVAWYLRRLEPPEVTDIPTRLDYTPDKYDPKVLTDELRQIEAELGDEFTDLAPPSTPLKETRLVLIYPHRRVGTLPMNTLVESMIPMAEGSARLRVALVDGETNEEFAGWVMRDGRYIWGLGDFYRRHRLPIGCHITFRATQDPMRFIVSFKGHRPRTEYIRLAIPNNGKLKFENFKRSIGAEYDELLILGAEDIDGVDDVWAQTRNRRRGLAELMSDLIPELARLNPQNAVHAKTLYSAVNIIRRCPPGPLFALLASRASFQHVGGPYWRLAESN
jgi:hypothetical protein